MSLLTVVQSALGRLGITEPAIVAGSTDLLVKQAMRLANEEGTQLSTGASVRRSFNWSALQTEATWTTVATESQGTVESIAPGFKSLIGETIWIRDTQMRPTPISPQQWQMAKATTLTGVWPYFRIVGGEIKMYPAPTAGQTAAFEYRTRYWAQSSSGTDQAAYADDTDVALLDEELIILGLKWRLLKAKGMAFDAEFSEYGMAVLDAMARDGASRVLSLGEREYSPRDSLYVPEGSWSP